MINFRNFRMYLAEQSLERQLAIRLAERQYLRRPRDSGLEIAFLDAMEGYADTNGRQSGAGVLTS